MSKLNLKGLWIPIEVMMDKSLSDKEKIIYSLIIFLSQDNGCCYCANKTISELLDISITQVSKLINSLKEKGYINTEITYKENSKQVESRKLIPVEEKFNILFNKSLNTYSTNVKYPTLEKFKDNKYINKNINKYNDTGQFFKKSKANFEERDYTGFDFTKLYANRDMIPIPS